MKNSDCYDYDGLSDIVVSHVLQESACGNIELYAGHRSFCDLYICKHCDTSIVYRVEPITKYAIRKYDGISSKPITIGYGNKNACVAWIKRNCSNVSNDVSINCNYHIDDYVNGNGYSYVFRIEYIEEEDYYQH